MQDDRCVSANGEECRRSEIDVTGTAAEDIPSGYDDDISIRFHPYASRNFAVGGRLLSERIVGLYAIEGEIRRRRTADERRAVRQEKSRPIIEEFELWLRARLDLISQKTRRAEAIRYALSRWQGLTRFIDDGRIEIHSNVVERAIHPIALNLTV